MTAALLVLRKFFSAVPWWVWLVLVALAWGGWQRHQAKASAEKFAQAAAKAAADREAQLIADANETARRLEAQEGVARVARNQAKKNAADAASARTAAEQLRARLAAIQVDARPADTAATAGGETAGTTASVLADLFGRCVVRSRELAEYADAASNAGSACETSYEALKARR